MRGDVPIAVVLPDGTIGRMHRALATVETVTATAPIEAADAIERARVRGWDVVVKKGEFRPGDTCLYIEIDAFVPLDDPRFAFLEARGRKVVDGRAGHVLRTAKLRGAYSQGLVIGVASFPELAGIEVGTDVTDLLGIVKYEPPIPAELAAAAVGPYPSAFAPRTDAERVQNLVEDFATLRSAARWTATEKIDGTSVTYVNDDGRLRVASRNWELAVAETTQWSIADELGLLALLEPGDALQGELYGEGIQSNPLRIRGQRFAPFALWRGRRPVPRDAWPVGLAALAVPQLELALPDSVEACLEQADGLYSSINPERRAEGIVWHSDGAVFDTLGGRGCFKAISNAYLLKHAG
jgi:RNA ligase (TIGR02306 family)